MADDVQLTVVTLQFDATDPGALLAILSKYVVVSRMHPGCRNIDLCGSATEPGVLLVIEKWETPAAQQAHFDSADMVEMARSCAGLLAHAPRVELWDGLSAHDLT